jgi:hypothetical protein
MTATLRTLLFTTVMLLVSTAIAENSGPATVVDTGSFSIMVKGQRVATETFKMEQKNGSNLVVSQLRLEDPKVKAVQSAEMEITPTGSLRRYTWKELSPGKAQIVVEPQDEAFLTVRVSETDTQPAKDLSRPLSPFTNILDDNFFSQLQVLTWKYMAMGCKVDAVGNSQCSWGDQRMQVLNPHQQQSLVVTISYLGEQKMRLQDQDKSYNAFRLKGENGEWMLWVDDKNRLVRVLIAADGIEVLRD